MSNFDSPWKEALDEHFPRFLAFFFPKCYARIDWARDYESLDGELRPLLADSETGELRVDRLVKFWLREEFGGDERLLHLEFQAHRETGFAYRVHRYNSRAEDKKGTPVITYVVLGDDNPTWRPSKYRFKSMGCRKVFRWVLVKLLDWTGREDDLEKDENPFGLFTLAHLKAKETHGDHEARTRWKLHLLLSLHTRRLEASELGQWYRYLDWLLDLPREYNERIWAEIERLKKEQVMPFVTFAEQYYTEKGMEKGMEKGLEKGREQGLEIGLLAGIEALLEVKFGQAGKELMPRIKQLTDVTRLERLIATIKTASALSEIDPHLPAATANGQG